MTTVKPRMKQSGNHQGRSALKIVQSYFPDVTSVLDADKDITIEVTGKDQAVAKRYKHKECAMAVACKRAKNLDGVIVSVGTVYLVKDKKAIRLKTPSSVSREVVSFDRGGGFSSGKYTLKAPGPGRRLGERGGHKPKTGKGSKYRKFHYTEGIRSILGSEVEA